MRPLFASLLLLLIAAFVATPAYSTSHCEFVLGFKTLRDLIGHDVVGECLENQRYNAIGNSEQQTTSGLLVWRKADNWTAFTDGHRTWISGPNGLEQRLNTERFAWEPDYAPGGSIATPPPRPTTPPSTPTPRPTIDPILAHSYHVMRRSESGNKLADLFVKLGASATFGALGNSISQWRSSLHRITINEEYRNESPEALAYALIWPTVGLVLHNEQGLPQSWEECIQRRISQESARARYWLETYGANGKPNPTQLEQWANHDLARYLDGRLGNSVRSNDHAREQCARYGEPAPMPAPTPRPPTPTPRPAPTPVLRPTAATPTPTPAPRPTCAHVSPTPMPTPVRVWDRHRGWITVIPTPAPRWFGGFPTTPLGETAVFEHGAATWHVTVIEVLRTNDRALLREYGIWTRELPPRKEMLAVKLEIVNQGEYPSDLDFVALRIGTSARPARWLSDRETSPVDHITPDFKLRPTIGGGSIPSSSEVRAGITKLQPGETRIGWTAVKYIWKEYYSQRALVVIMGNYPGINAALEVECR